MTRFSLALASVFLLLGAGAAELDFYFSADVGTTGTDVSTIECSLIEMMELKLRLASSFQSNGRKFFKTKVVLGDFEEVDEVGVVEEANNEGRELNARDALTSVKEPDDLAQGKLRGVSKHERELYLAYKVYKFSGGFGCRIACNPDNHDRRDLSDTSNFDDYITKHMTKDFKAYIIKKSLNGSTSCYGDPENAFVDFAILE